MKISTIYKSANVLGESPFWHSDKQSVFWVDIEQCTVHELNLNTDQHQSWNVGRRVSVILKADGDALVIGVQGGIMNLDLTTGNTKILIPVDQNNPKHRCNDGAIDSTGRIWVGTMEEHGEENAGGLFKIEGENVEKIIENITIPNGITWSHNNKTMYFTDTMNSVIKSYAFEPEKGNITFVKNAITIPEDMGMPDGLTIDREGMLWIALYGGSGISRWHPDSGDLLRFIKLPALNITNCCFVGKDLVVTSAKENLTDQQLAQYPESGNLFLISEL
ncbi:MAG: SMP-30/gluconolactonase/LRE family protein [Pedobacter sp.]|nr:MAG: SMP-30/gluconolactonase/LRE family protein [Pedobacter sp.]